MINIGEWLVILSGNVFLFFDLFMIKDVYWIKDGKKIDIEKSGGWLLFDIENCKLIIKYVSKEDVGNYKFIVINLVGLIISDVIVFGILRKFYKVI